MYTKLESLRGVAACLVALGHSRFTYGESPIVFVQNNYIFVDFFFILSGFVIAFVYSNKIREGMSFRSYFILRFGRIYPLHFFVLLMFVPVILLKQYLYSIGIGIEDPSVNNNIYTFLLNITLLHSMGLHNTLTWNEPSWSISVEFFTYMAFYFLSLSLDKKNNLLTPLLISIICYGILINLGRKEWDIATDFGFIRCMAAFYIGVLIYRIKKYNLLIDNIKKNVYLYEILSVTFAVVGVTLAGEYPLLNLFSIISLSLVVLIFSSTENGIIGNILNMNILRKIGAWSYSIYMLHWFIFGGITNLIEDLLKYDLNEPLGIYSVIANILLLFITIYISRFTYKYIETVFRKLAKQKVNP
jgi:peptidoglycan/LPS O-acetylase OafA/YrhL